MSIGRPHQKVRMSVYLNPILRTVALGLLVASGTGCGGADPASVPDAEEEEDELRAATVVVELALGTDGACAMRSPPQRVKYGRVVRLKNVGTAPIAALIDLWDNLGGMPAPEGGDIEPGKFVSVKMSTRWWVLQDDPESREWWTKITCKKGPWADVNVDFEEVGEIQVFR